MKAAVGILCRYSLLDPRSGSKGQYGLQKIVQEVCKWLLPREQKLHYTSQAMSLVATALVGIKTTLPWIDDPAAFDLQNLLLPHVASIHKTMHTIFDDLVRKDVDMVSEIVSLFAKTYAATGHYNDAKELIERFSFHLKREQLYDVGKPFVRKLIEQEATCSAQLGEHLSAYQLRRQIYAWQEGQDLAGS